MINYKALGKRIAFYRKKSNLTQTKLAEKLDVSTGYISQIECGKAEVSLKRLDEISEILSIDIAFLVSDTNINSVNFGNSELYNIINTWTSVEKSFLLNLVKCADEQLSDNKQNY